jgi:hypothetical protein
VAEEKQAKQKGLQAQHKAKKQQEKKAEGDHDSDDENFNYHSTGGSYKGIKLEVSNHAIADDLPEVTGPIVFKKRKLKNKKKGLRKKSRGDDD